MTQEELDALMNGDIDDLESLEDDGLDGDENVNLEDENSEDFIDDFEDKTTSQSENDISKKQKNGTIWPMPATNENKMVHQLDDVTKESEEKASEIFDIIENVSNELMGGEDTLNSVIEVLQGNIDLFETLHKKFPDVKAFEVQLEKNSTILDEANQTLEILQTAGGEIMNVMDIMQYQDIHRQKIERVINVMRALSNYMNSLFEGKIDDDKRVSSATHIAGDTHNEVASNEDIEALLAQFVK